MRNIIKYFSVAVMCLLMATGCKKAYLDINQTPNDITANKVTSDLILPYALHNAGAQSTGYGWLNHWTGYWSPSGSFAPNEEETTYNITTGFGQTRWNSLYNMLYDFYNVESKATEEDILYYVGIAKVMKARYFQDLVDMWGNVPYSQAFQIKKFPTPKYDRGVEIYADLQVQLDLAIEIFKNQPVPAAANTVDIMFHGHAEDWIELANTIKLRLLIRQSETPGFNPTPELTKIQTNGPLLGSGATADLNPGYSNALGKQSPFYAAYGFTVTGANASELERANRYVVNVLKTNSDPRLSRYFRPAGNPANPADPYLGTIYGAPSNETVYGGGRTSAMGPGVAGNAAQDQWIITSVESLFLQAEAVARGWLPGTAQTAYENAVRESFVWLSVPNALTAANTYMANNASANWANAGGSVAERVRFIAYQKYLSMVGFNPLEAWSDYRRLGVPADLPLSVNPGRVGPGLPVRLLYPTAEYAVNSNSVGAEGSVNQFTSRIFWDQ